MSAASARRRGWVVIVVAVAAVTVLRFLLERPLDGGVTLALPSAQAAVFRGQALLGGIAVGAALGVAGLLMQVLLRNALASPFVLGVSSGAGFGVMAGSYVNWVAGAVVVTEFAEIGAAAAGAGLALALVMALGRRHGVLDPLSLVLAGAVISAIFGALIMLLQHLVPHGLRGDLVTWMMGRIPETPAPALLWSALLIAAAGTLLAAILGGAMDVAVFGDDEAISIGLDLVQLRRVLLIAAGVLCAAAVALAGPIAFVGLVAPHAARALIGPRHRALAIASAVIGAALVVGADVARQALPIGGGRVPVGVFTALLGGPAFLWILRRGATVA